jgi:hypothetical protein
MFKTQPGHGLSRGFRWFSQVPPGEHRDITSVRPQPLPSKAFLIPYYQSYCSPLYNPDKGSVVKWPAIVGPANQYGCIILRVGNLADEKVLGLQRGIPYEVSRDRRSSVDRITAEPLPTSRKSISLLYL